MQMTEERLHKIANLAYLEISDAQKPKLMEHMQQMLQVVDILDTVNTEGVSPLVHIHGRTNVCRPDEVKASLPREALLQNAFEHTEEAFVVPRVLG